MSKERQLLKEALEWMLELTYVWEDKRSDTNRLLLELKADINKIEELLAQPEQTKQEPMTGGEISEGFRVDKEAINAESYWAGVEFAEKHHGITGGEE